MANKKSAHRVKQSRNLLPSYKAYMKKYLPKIYAQEEKFQFIPKSMNR